MSDLLWFDVCHLSNSEHWNRGKWDTNWKKSFDFYQLYSPFLHFWNWNSHSNEKITIRYVSKEEKIESLCFFSMFITSEKKKQVGVYAEDMEKKTESLNFIFPAFKLTNWQFQCDKKNQVGIYAVNKIKNRETTPPTTKTIQKAWIFKLYILFPPQLLTVPMGITPKQTANQIKTTDRKLKPLILQSQTENPNEMITRSPKPINKSKQARRRTRRDRRLKLWMDEDEKQRGVTLCKEMYTKKAKIDKKKKALCHPPTESLFLSSLSLFLSLYLFLEMSQCEKGRWFSPAQNAPHLWNNRKLPANGGSYRWVVQDTLVSCELWLTPSSFSQRVKAGNFVCFLVNGDTYINRYIKIFIYRESKDCIECMFDFSSSLFYL